MKILNNKSKASTVALVLSLTIAATLMTWEPATFGQKQLVPTSRAWFVLFRPTIGLGQTQMVRSTIYPTPYSINHTYTIFRPDGTNFTMVNASDPVTQEAFVTFVCDQLGTWRVDVDWPGDSYHTHPSKSNYIEDQWVVTSESVPYPEKIPMQVLVSTVPKDKIGTGGIIYIVGWVHPPREYITAMYPRFDFVITKPDGTTVTHTEQPESPATSSFSYICDQAGEYSVVMKFPEDYLHQAGESPAWTWTVEDGYEVPVWPSEPLPTGEWSYPISLEYREWFQISGPWPQSTFDDSSSNFNPWSTAPNTPHVLWRKQTDLAGITGGSQDHGGGGWTGQAARCPTCVAAMGRLYYTTTDRYLLTDGKLGSTHPVLWCIDQFTGEVIYKKDIPGIGSGGTPIIEILPEIKIEPYQETELTVSRRGALSLWLTSGGLWEIDPTDGTVLYYNPSLRGSRFFYAESAFYFTNYPEVTNLTKWDCRSKSIIWTNDAGIHGSQPAWIGSFPYLVWNGILVSGQQGEGNYPWGITVRSWNATDGTRISTGVDTGLYSSETSFGRCVGDGKLFTHASDRRVHAINIYTGQEVWVSEEMEYPWGAFTAYNTAVCYGMVIYQSWDGHLYAFDMETGATKWKGHYTGDTTETAMGTYAWWGKLAVADHKIYGATGEHTPPKPYPKGNRLYCLSADTGEYIWSLPWFTGSGGISSGMLFQTNTYDGCLYSFGKGPTATTVLASPKTMANGANVLIEGTVTDQSPGAPDTPAVSDASQEEWVQYLYMNKPMPTNATGVSVLLQAMHSDGTVIDIGWATSDIMGHYEYTWTPPAEDTYKILATFMGSESYWMSSAQTALSVGPAPEAPAEPTEEPAYTTIDLAIIAAVVVAIVIGIVNLYALRKRK